MQPDAIRSTTALPDAMQPNSTQADDMHPHIIHTNSLQLDYMQPTTLHANIIKANAAQSTALQRNTVQRQIIIETLKKSKAHPSVDEIYSEIHLTHPSISKTTVYRNLRQLTQIGIINQISLPDGLERYDGNTVKHHHFRCNICGSVFDVDIEYSESINDTVRQAYGFQVDEHEIVFKGICEKCIKDSITIA